ncbi:hypothetical protein DFP78_104122 [Photobacterium lutimaris]|nr:hypothetical protein DFP78_104122 [Photobacterium lutimaris]
MLSLITQTAATTVLARAKRAVLRTTQSVVSVVVLVI